MKLTFLLTVLVFALGNALILKMPRQRLRQVCFVLWNILGNCLAFQIAKPLIVLYVLLVSGHFLLARRQKHAATALLATLTPVAILISFRILPASIIGYAPDGAAMTALFVGLSFMAFRLTRASVDIRLGKGAGVGYWEYLGFAFYLPTFWVGPITRLADFRASLAEPGKARDLVDGFARLVMGLGKFVLLSNLLYRVSFEALFADRSLTHDWTEFWISCVSYYLYLYCNFSGFCDIAVGAAKISGIRIDENFNSPFVSKNIPEFWNRWHITLSAFLKDLVFNPLSKFLVGKWGVKHLLPAFLLSSLTIFLLIGVWHGFAWNYFFFGLMHGLAVVAHQLYDRFLRRRLSSAALAAYQSNPWISGIRIGLTFLFVSLSMFLFANNWETVLYIVKSLTV